MLRRLLLVLQGLAVAVIVMAQATFMSNDNIAVFIPANYDTSCHQPSPIFVQELVPTAALPHDWRLKPVFSQREGKQIATIHVGEGVDLYGTGEVTGPLKRNGRKISLWNIDTPAYGVDGGSHLYQSHPWVMGLRADGSAFGIYVPRGHHRTPQCATAHAGTC